MIREIFDVIMRRHQCVDDSRRRGSPKATSSLAATIRGWEAGQSSGVAFGAYDEANYSAGLIPTPRRRINIARAELKWTGCVSEEI
jgi:hypothetical protein